MARLGRSVGSMSQPRPRWPRRRSFSQLKASGARSGQSPSRGGSSFPYVFSDSLERQGRQPPHKASPKDLQHRTRHALKSRVQWKWFPYRICVRYIYIYTYIHMHICMYVCMHVCMYVRMYVCLFTYISYRLDHFVAREA